MAQLAWRTGLSGELDHAEQLIREAVGVRQSARHFARARMLRSCRAPCCGGNNTA